jgi:tetratricopeptide (TPR) repeat protein
MFFNELRKILRTLPVFVILVILSGCSWVSSEKSTQSPVDYKLLSQISGLIREGNQKLERHSLREAEKLAEEALELLEKNNCPLSVEYGEAWVLLGKVAVSEKKWDVAGNYYGRALEIQVTGKLSEGALKLSDEAFSLGGIPEKFVAEKLKNLGNRYAQMELRHQVAYTFLCLDGMGDLFVARGDFSNALIQQKKTVDFLKQYDHEPSLSLVRSLEKLSKSLRATGDNSEAAKVLEESKVVSKQWHEVTRNRRKSVDKLMNSFR